MSSAPSSSSSAEAVALHKLIDQQRLTCNDWIDVADQDDDNSFDAAFLEEFENAWSQYLLRLQTKNQQQQQQEQEKHSTSPEHCQPQLPSLLMTSRQRGQHIVELQTEADAVLQSKIKMENEMKQQIAFFHWGQEQSEKKFTKKIQATLEEQQKERERLEGKIAALEQAERIHEQTLPWFHFMNELDRLVVEKDVISKNNDASTSRKVARPSARALLLARSGPRSSNSSSQHNPSHGRAAADKLEWRASRIDRALLTAHAAMLHKEIERCETMLAIHKEVGQFLTEHDIWSILKGSDGDSHDSSGTNSNHNSNSNLSNISMQRRRREEK